MQKMTDTLNHVDLFSTPDCWVSVGVCSVILSGVCPAAKVPKSQLKEHLLELRRSGYILLGVEQTHTSVPLDQSGPTENPGKSERRVDETCGREFCLFMYSFSMLQSSVEHTGSGFGFAQVAIFRAHSNIARQDLHCSWSFGALSQTMQQVPRRRVSMPICCLYSTDAWRFLNKGNYDPSTSRPQVKPLWRGERATAPCCPLCSGSAAHALRSM